MKCKDFQNNIVFYIDKELIDEEVKEFNQHLKSCDSCARLYLEVKNSYLGIQEQLITESNPFFYSRVKSMLEGQKEKSYVIHRNKKLVLQWVAYIVIGFIAITSGYLIANDSNYIEEESAKNNYEMSDEELFVDSHYLTLSTDDLYVVSIDETE